MTQPQIRIISWGLGVCSTAMAVMSVLGDLPPVDAIVNTDPGWELPTTYEAREFYADWFRDRGITVIIEQTGDIRNDGLRPFCRIPFRTETGAPLKRRCTGDYKRDPMKRIARRLAGYDERKFPHPPVDSIEVWLGFTLDEWHRMKAAPQKFMKFEHPLVQEKITRSDCIEYFNKHGLLVPPRSACICCPFRKASEWIEIRDTMPKVWQDAIMLDREIRTLSRVGGTAQALYLFKGPGNMPEPLEMAPLEKYAEREKTLEWFQMPLLCGDGGCWT